ATELHETRRECASLHDAAHEAEAKRAAHETRRQIAEGDITAARAALDTASAAVATHDRLIHETRDQLDALRNRCNQSDIALAEQRLRAEHLTQSVREKYGTELADTPIGELTEEETQALARLDTLREKLARIGDVNVGAIEELRELEERALFLR